MRRYNSTAKTSLNFKSPNEIVSEYFSKCNVCLTTKRSMVEVTIMSLARIKMNYYNKDIHFK